MMSCSMARIVRNRRVVLLQKCIFYFFDSLKAFHEIFNCKMYFVTYILFQSLTDLTWTDLKPIKRGFHLFWDIGNISPFWKFSSFSKENQRQTNPKIFHKQHVTALLIKNKRKLVNLGQSTIHKPTVYLLIWVCKFRHLLHPLCTLLYPLFY